MRINGNQRLNYLTDQPYFLYAKVGVHRHEEEMAVNETCKGCRVVGHVDFLHFLVSLYVCLSLPEGLPIGTLENSFPGHAVFVFTQNLQLGKVLPTQQ